jgi:hypothetical protein
VTLSASKNHSAQLGVDQTTAEELVFSKQQNNENIVK